jgi:hypothetical protein
MAPEPQAALRNDADQVTEVQPDGAVRPVLGTAHPDDADKRAKVLRRWGQPASPRAERLATIDEPLPQRSQTILSHEVDATLRQRLNGGGSALAQSRKAGAGGTHPRRRP